MVNGTDAKFLSKVQQMHGNHKHYIMPKRNNCPDPDTRNCFGVVHFAGDVFYNVRDFVEKNKVRPALFFFFFFSYLPCFDFCFRLLSPDGGGGGGGGGGISASLHYILPAYPLAVVERPLFR